MQKKNYGTQNKYNWYIIYYSQHMCPRGTYGTNARGTYGTLFDREILLNHTEDTQTDKIHGQQIFYWFTESNKYI